MIRLYFARSSFLRSEKTWTWEQTYTYLPNIWYHLHVPRSRIIFLLHNIIATVYLSKKSILNTFLSYWWKKDSIQVAVFASRICDPKFLPVAKLAIWCDIAMATTKICNSCSGYFLIARFKSDESLLVFLCGWTDRQALWHI